MKHFVAHYEKAYNIIKSLYENNPFLENGGPLKVRLLQSNEVYTLDSLMWTNLYMSNIHCLAKTWIYLTPYVCTERIFDSRPLMYNKIFLKKSF